MKKIIALCILCAFSMLWFAPNGTAAKPNSLYEFLKTNENISASFSYPSMLLTANGSGKKTLQAHTPVIIQADTLINTNNIIDGDSICFSIYKDVKDQSGHILIKKGTPVRANIHMEKAGNVGKSAKILITDFHTTGIDGSYIPLSSSISVTPDDKMVLSVVLSVCICPLFLLMDGENAQIPAGTTKTVYTGADVYIKVNAI